LYTAPSVHSLDRGPISNGDPWRGDIRREEHFALYGAPRAALSIDPVYGVLNDREGLSKDLGALLSQNRREQRGSSASRSSDGAKERLILSSSLVWAAAFFISLALFVMHALNGRFSFVFLLSCIFSSFLAVAELRGKRSSE
jgi:hypothetical protein